MADQQYNRERDIWMRALAIVESGDDPKAWGDGGRAMGRWQVHPAWMDEWAGRAELDMTWDEWVRAALEGFYFALMHGVASVSPTDMAEAFHLGETSLASCRRDYEYRAKFLAALERAKQEMK